MIIKVLDALGEKLQNEAILDFAGSFAVSQIQKNILKGNWVPNSALTASVKGNALPLRDKGQLLSSFHSRTEGMVAIVGTNHPAAEILHKGGTITPKRTKYLAIPAGAQSRACMRRYGATPRACIEGMKRAGFNVWFSGHAVLAQPKKDVPPFLLFILKTSVKIPARPFMTLTAESLALLSSAVTKRLFP